jgi:hypothetical protein
MKCRYLFPVVSKIRLSQPIRMGFPGTTVELKLSDTGMVNLLSVTVDAADPATWPSIQPSREPGIRWSLDTGGAASDEVMANVHTLESLLALFGLESVIFHAASLQWVPETPEESTTLAMTAFALNSQPVPDSEYELIPPDLMARAIAAAPTAHHLEVPLGFYRKGVNDLHEGRYIAAFYQFYFLVETLFAHGKHRSAAVKQEFKRARPLTQAIANVLRPEETQAFGPVRRQLLFERHYLCRSVEETIDYWVELRGFLHHHSLGRPTTWHPRGDERYEIDAYVIGRVAFEIAYGLAAPLILDRPAPKTTGS